VPVARTFVLATGNAGKLKEFQSLLGDACRLIPQAQLGVTAVAETGASFHENALLKARHAAEATGLPSIADDSGLEVDALDGAPGVHSARFAGERCDDEANNALLLERLAAVDPDFRGARFRCVVVAVWPDSQSAPLISEGVWEGRIAMNPRGTSGFGYDPLFIDAQTGRTSAELSAVEKNRRSHRGKAVRQLRELLNTAPGRAPAG
jgi:XTP/dITP diphosphohydrolase